MLILECAQGCYAVKVWPSDLDLWPWKSIGFQTLLRTKYVPSLVKIHWRMLILECLQGCCVVKIWSLYLWTWKSIGFQNLLRTMYVPSLVKIHWRMLILECSQGCYVVKIWPGDIDIWPMTLNIMDFHQTWYRLSLGESGTLLMFKVIGQRSMSPGQIFTT
jgi:hypothetical protein